MTDSRRPKTTLLSNLRKPNLREKCTRIARVVIAAVLLLFPPVPVGAQVSVDPDLDPALKVPTIKLMHRINKGYQVYWSPPTDYRPSGYDLRYAKYDNATSSWGMWTDPISNLSGTRTLITGLEATEDDDNPIRYRTQMRAWFNSKHSNWSSIYEADLESIDLQSIQLPDPPTRPGLVIGATKFTVSWSHPGTSNNSVAIVGYEVRWRGAVGATTSSSRLAATVTSYDIPFADHNLDANAYYEFFVRAHASPDQGESRYTNSPTIETMPTVQPPRDTTPRDTTPRDTTPRDTTPRDTTPTDDNNPPPPPSGVQQNPPPSDTRDVDVRRVAGPTRVETSVDVADTYVERLREDGIVPRSVIVATKLRFPDALAASSLAGLVKAPILLTDLETLPKVTADFIERQKLSRVFIMGGPAAVSHDVERALKALDPVREVIRLGGADRYETSVKIAEWVGQPGGFCGTNRSTVVLAIGTRFPDALAAAPVSAVGKHPLLLSYLDELPLTVRRHLRQGRLDGSIHRVLIVGGTNAISESVGRTLERLGLRTVRVGGADRYETAALLAEHSVARGRPTPANCLGNRAAAIVTGRNFADALVAGPLLAYVGGPTLLLDPPNFIPRPVVEVLRGDLFDPSQLELLVIGGPNALPDRQLQWVRTILRDSQ